MRERSFFELSVLWIFLNDGTMAEVLGDLRIMLEQYRVSKRRFLYQRTLNRRVKCGLFEGREELRCGVCIGGFGLLASGFCLFGYEKYVVEGSGERAW